LFHVPPVQFHRRANLPAHATPEEVRRARAHLDDEYWDLRERYPLASKDDYDLGHVPGERIFGWVAQTVA
jgi:hypothetical protein